MKHSLQSILFAVLSLSLPAFAAGEAPAATKAAQAILVPSVTFVRASVPEVIRWLNIKSKALDPKKEGVHIIQTGATDPAKTVDLQRTNATVLEILQAAAEQAGLELQTTDNEIRLIAKPGSAASTNRPAAPAERGVPAALAASPEGWTDDFAQAVEKAKAEKKNLLLDFTGSDWCGFCISLDKEVFATGQFKSWARQNAILVAVDFPKSGKQNERLKAQNADLKKKFMPSGGFPTVVLIDADGKVMARKTGYRPGTGPVAYLEGLNGAAPVKY